MARRLLCIHGHFYQPPRENPWLEEVEVQDSASPFHDWNARITAECYGPNGAARIKSAADRITDIVNNYRHISFNFGPTLLAWLERSAPDVYRAILEADASSLARRGHGNAIAQGYNHAILPLCSPRDRATQIRWGVADFRHRFRRAPEGFWLPETAVDVPTLTALVDEGIRFTVLSPYQVTRVRPPGGEWLDAAGGRFDPTRPYRVGVGGGRSIAVFFYDGPIARSLAFAGALDNAAALLGQIESGFDASRGHDEVLTIAVDGETFGHHKKGGDEALAAALRRLPPDITLVNFPQALDAAPLEWEAEIDEGSSWSCAHGLGRWRSDCGCSASGQPGWRQAWRAPLREALDRLRDRLDAIYEEHGGAIFADPWATRDDFIALILDAERAGAAAFLERHARHPLDDGERTRALTLLEMQRQSQLMFTSCGWFFAEISGLETVQILKYAARAIQLARDVAGVELEPRLRADLSRAPSNLPEVGDGDAVYARLVLPSVFTLENVAAHYAIASLFEDHPDEGRVFCYRYRLRSRRREAVGPATLAVGRLELESVTVGRRLDASFGVLHFGGADLRCGLRAVSGPGGRGGDRAQEELERTLIARLGELSLAELVREIDRAFTGRDYTLRDLFLDERRRMAALLLGETLGRCQRDYFQIFATNRRLMEFLRQINSPIPMPLRVAADVGLTHELEQAAEELLGERMDVDAARTELLRVVELAAKLGARLDLEVLRRSFDEQVRRRVERLGGDGRPGEVQELLDLLELACRLGLRLDLWSAQNHLWDWAKSGGGRLDPGLLARLAEALYLDDRAFLTRARGARHPVEKPA